MPLTPFTSTLIKKEMESFMEKRRPPEEIRDDLDIGYRVEKQSVVLFEIRPVWNDPGKKVETPFAKTTYVKTQNIWKIYWQRADLKWHAYPLSPEVNSFTEFLDAVHEDELCCFFG